MLTIIAFIQAYLTIALLICIAVLIFLYRRTKLKAIIFTICFCVFAIILNIISIINKINQVL